MLFPESLDAGAEAGLLLVQLLEEEIVFLRARDQEPLVLLDAVLQIGEFLGGGGASVQHLLDALFLVLQGFLEVGDFPLPAGFFVFQGR